MKHPHPGKRGVRRGAPCFCPLWRWDAPWRVPGIDWACPAGRGGEGAEREGEMGGTPCRLARGRTEQAGDARGAGAHGVRRAPVKLLDKCWTHLGRRRETPRKKEGGRLGGSASLNRRRGAGCGGVKRSFLMAKLVGCYSHPKCFCLPSEARRKKVPQSEAESRPKRLENQSRL